MLFDCWDFLELKRFSACTEKSRLRIYDPPQDFDAKGDGTLTAF